MRSATSQPRPELILRRACILDFDGVIADTEPVHAEAKRRTLERFGIAHPPTIFDAFKGRTDVDFFESVVADLAPDADSDALLAAKRGFYQELFGEVRLVAGFADFLAVARTGFARLGVATSATRADFELVVDRFGLERAFDAIVTSDDTTRSKPDPEPYLVALDRLGLPARAALAVEDSPNGVLSAAAAGVLVVGLAGGFTADALLAAGASVIIEDLAELTSVVAPNLLT